MSHSEQEIKPHSDPRLSGPYLQQGGQINIDPDPREKEVADWLEKITLLQRINLVLLILTLSILTLHLFVDIFFNL